MQVVPNLGQLVGVCSHLHQEQRLEVSYHLLQNNTLPQLFRLTLVITLVLFEIDSLNPLHSFLLLITVFPLNLAPLLDFGSPVPAAQPSSDLWGDFTSAGSK